MNRKEDGMNFGKGQKRKNRIRAFTLAELIVSMVVLIILLGITGMIYKVSSDAVRLNNATVTATSDFNALTRQVKTALDGIDTDGYLVIYGRKIDANLAEKTAEGKILYNATNGLKEARSDVICFFTTGNFKSMKDNTTTANSGWVYLGHTGQITPAGKYGTSPYDGNSATNPLIVNRWVLSRYQILFTPGKTGGDYRDTSIGRWMAFISTNPDVVAKDYGKIRDLFFDYWLNSVTIGTPPAVDFDNNITFAYTLPNSGSFKVEFAMPASFPGSLNTNGAKDQPERYTAGNIVWRDAMTPNPSTPQATTGFDQNNANMINAGDITGGRPNDQMVVFGPSDPWPIMIRFTLRKYDENLSLISEDAEPNSRHGGVTLEYVYKLPARQ